MATLTAADVQLILDEIATLAAARTLQKTEAFLAERIGTAPVANFDKDTLRKGFELYIDPANGSLGVRLTSDARLVEDGKPAVNLKERFKNATSSPKRKIGFNNNWYYDIPFYFASAAEIDAWKQGQVNFGGRSLRQVNSNIERTLMQQPNALQEGAREGVKLTPNGLAKSARKFLNIPEASVKLFKDNKVGMQKNIIMHPTSNTMMGNPSSTGVSQVFRTQFATIRRISAASDPSSWWAPAQPGLQLVPQAKQYFSTEVEATATELMDQLLK